MSSKSKTTITIKNQNTQPIPFRILHFGYARSLGPGVKAQIIAEVEAADSLHDIRWDSIFFSHSDPSETFMRLPTHTNLRFLPQKLAKYLNLRISAYRWLLANQAHYDAVLLRYPLGDPLLGFIVGHIINLFTIHHTKELNEIRSAPTLLSRLHCFIELFTSRRVFKHSLGIIGLTNEITQYELNRSKLINKPVYVSANGIAVSTDIRIKDQRGGVIKLVIICSKAYPWHGLDLIKKELENNDRKDVEIHVIGNLTESTLGIDQRVIYHGMIKQEDLTSILGQFDLGIGSLALHRNNMTEACILKTRDYLATGTPVLANYQDSGLPVDFPYFINHKFNLNIAINLADKFRGVSRAQIINEASPYIDKKELLKNQALWIKDVTQKSNY